MSDLSSVPRLAKCSGGGRLATTNDGGVPDRLQLDRADIRRRRLLFRCWHRGTQEGDLILGRFVESYLPSLDGAQIERLENLLDCTDPDLFDWIVSGIPAPKEYDHDVMRLLRSFALHDNRKIEKLRTVTTTQEC
jgi:antitoxin CptB